MKTERDDQPRSRGSASRGGAAPARGRRDRDAGRRAVPRGRPQGAPGRKGRRGARRAGGFTLIEVMVVILILGLLATVVAPSVFQHVDTAKRTTARSQIQMLAAALDAYRLDNDVYPSTGQGLEALRREPLSEPKPPDWQGPYLRQEVPLDPWERPYVYVSPGEANPWSFDLMSYGRDGEPGGTGEDADIRSWE